MMRLNRCYWILIALASSACSSSGYLTKAIQKTEKDLHDHVGFVLFDPSTQKTICDYQGDQYFTPASNTKIFTLYASLKILGDSIPALKYSQRNDSIIFWGTGDPGFLYENTFHEDRVYNFLKNNTSKIFFSSSNFQTTHFGAGWAWDDYNDAYQVERTPFPIYGNYASVKKSIKSFTASPDVFQYSIMEPSVKERGVMKRSISENKLTYIPGKTDRPRQWKIPFHYSDELLTKLLTDTLKKEVSLINVNPTSDVRTIYSSTPPDSLYKVLMQESDNFIAEQLLLICSGVVSDTLKTEIAIKYVKKNYLTDLPDEPIWVDGSGLSRYNLFTPRSVIRLWEKIYAIVPRERLFHILAIGGERGTIKNYYKGEKPFIFGKTGTLSNNHILSGYLVTRKGKTFIFSWMNNNFTAPTGEVRSKMEELLKKIYEKY
ncbi:MAG: D-alanyl-D-alanine carboxypeptidase [Cyclobacteriaceae bacterium]|nr:D-alanyl-D-alanine carboxypeptidase [Cyclobacteriaceae bacterium]